MKEELEQKLYEKYPKIFRQKDLSMQETCMCWGICVGDGWYDLVDGLCSVIQHHTENIESNNDMVDKWIEEGTEPYYEKRLVPCVEAVQVKEKFGGLRFYYQGGDDFVDGAVSMAEVMSYKICEECGDSGRPDDSRWSWIRTLCSECRSLEEENKYKKVKKVKENA